MCCFLGWPHNGSGRIVRNVNYDPVGTDVQGLVAWRAWRMCVGAVEDEGCGT